MYNFEYTTFASLRQEIKLKINWNYANETNILYKYSFHRCFRYQFDEQHVATKWGMNINLHIFVACDFYFYFQLPKITTRLISHRFPRLFRSSRNSRKRGERDCIRQIWWASLHSKITLCRIRKLRSGMKSLPRDSFHETRDAASYPGNIYFYPSRNHWLLLPWNSYYTGAIKHTLVKRISYVERTTRSPCVIKKSINLDRMQKLN